MRRPHFDHAGVVPGALSEETPGLPPVARSLGTWPEAKYRGLFEHAVVGIFQSSPEGRYLDANLALAEIYGYDSPAELMRTLTDIGGQLYVDPGRRAEFVRLLNEHGVVTAFESPVRRRDGTVVWISESCREVRDGAGTLLYYEGVVKDITGRRRAGDRMVALNAELTSRLDRVAALRRIDLAIIEGKELVHALEVCLDQVVGQLLVDGAAVLLWEGDGPNLHVAAQRGLRTGLRTLRPPPGYDSAGRAVTASVVVHVRDLSLDPANAPQLSAEGFAAYFAVPLVAKGECRGVLKVFHQTPVDPGDEWVAFLETLAGQTAIAIDNACLFAELRRSNHELAAAYAATIAGWSRALDLRDEETEGHSRRVTELTLRLARAMGMPEKELAHLRRGALLHDIGKMGVPDRILRKPGPLSEEEWRVMRRHPQHAHDMLWPIEFLRPALDIPYCHHERWDGTGYPRGLKGEEIPLAARIFAVVDVWDALRSDRPYRPAWSERRVREHLRSVAGTHLDPAVVAVFLNTLGAPGPDDAPAPDAPPEALEQPLSEFSARPADGLRAAGPVGRHGLPILIAGDRSPSAQRVIRTLDELGHEVLVAADGDEAWRLVQQGRTRLVISDWAVSGIDGPQLCRRVRGLSGHPYVYIIVMTALGASEDRLECLHAGADDFLTKPFDLRELAARLEIARRILSMQEELEQKNARLAELVTVDALTGLKNRRHFIESLDASFALALRHNQVFSVILLDVDEFKAYNDTFGHPSGDEVLCAVARLLRANAREHDVVTRYGGEEFAILLPATDACGGRCFAERLRRAIREAVWPRARVTASFGIATYAFGTPSAAALVEDADRALYRSKRDGRDRVTHHAELI